MEFKVIKGDLFDMSCPPYVLAHCIASDFGMHGGIARQFVDNMNMRQLLWDWAKMTNQQLSTNRFYTTTEKYPKAVAGIIGTAIRINRVYNLITKKWTHEKPTYDALTDSLQSLKDQMVTNRETQLAMPKIGCGIDGLEWDVVEMIIKGVFCDTNISITIVEWVQRT